MPSILLPLRCCVENMPMRVEDGLPPSRGKTDREAVR